MNSKSNSTASDKLLIEQISKGNELAFAHFYNRHWDSVFISAFKVLKDEEACKDIVQELFLGIWESTNLKEIENVKGYLHKSVRYKVLMLLRKEKVSEKHLSTMETLVGNTTEEQLDFVEMNETIEKSIEALPTKCQEVFRLSRLENLTNQEIAQRLSISIRTVETHISNALRQIRSKLGSSAAASFIILLLSH